jgi:DNA-binding NarL/FixJ family response regulator
MAHHKPIRICLVEDDPVIRETLSSLFVFEDDVDLVGCYANGEDALVNIPALAPEVVIMDISMPGMGGIACVRELAQQLPGAQFLMYSMHDDDHRVFDALKAGANGYILKSSTPDQIMSAIVELHEGGAPMSTAVARRVVGHFRPIQERRELVDDKLSAREYEVLTLLAEGMLYKEIANRLGLTIGTVKQHIHRVYGKLHVENRVEAVNRYFGR